MRGLRTQKPKTALSQNNARERRPSGASLRGRYEFSQLANLSAEAAAAAEAAPATATPTAPPAAESAKVL